MIMYAFIGWVFSLFQALLQSHCYCYCLYVCMHDESDKSVRLWDIQTGNCVRILTGHTAAVTSLAISPSGKIAASAGCIS